MLAVAADRNGLPAALRPEACQWIRSHAVLPIERGGTEDRMEAGRNARAGGDRRTAASARLTAIPLRKVLKFVRRFRAGSQATSLKRIATFWPMSGGQRGEPADRFPATARVVRGKGSARFPF